MKLENLIVKKCSAFSEGDDFIANFILNNKKKIPSMSINRLAEHSLTSKSSILRFTQKLGFSGFTEFKSFVKWDLSLSDSQEDLNDIGSIIMNNVRDVVEYLSRLNFSDILQAIYQSRNIYLIGTGKQQQIQASEMQRLFLKIGKEMQLLEIGMYSQLYNLIVERLDDKDMIIIFSHSGDNPLLKEALSLPLVKGVKILSITSSGNNWLTKNSNFSIPLYINASADSSYRQYDSCVAFVLIDLLAYSYDQYKNEKISNQEVLCQNNHDG